MSVPIAGQSVMLSVSKSLLLSYAASVLLCVVVVCVRGERHVVNVRSTRAGAEWGPVVVGRSCVWLHVRVVGVVLAGVVYIRTPARSAAHTTVLVVLVAEWSIVQYGL